MPGKLTKLFLITTLLLVFSFSSVFAATVDKVEVKGSKRVPESTILNKAVKPGDKFDMGKINQSIKDIVDTGLVRDVKVDLNLNDERVIVTYIIKEVPFVNKVYFEGNTDIRENSLRDKIQDLEKKALNRGTLEHNIMMIKGYYYEENYYNVEVKVDVEERPGNTVDVVYVIKEGGEAKIKEIEIVGNEKIETDDILDVMETDEMGFFHWLGLSGQLKRHILDDDIRKIFALYKEKGYLNVKVTRPEIVTLKRKDRIKVVIKIEEGIQFKLASMKFEGNEHLTDEQLRRLTTMKVGEVFDNTKFRTDINKLTNAFTEIGYAFANIDPLRKLNEEKAEADLVYKVEENSLVRIGRINIRGNTITRDRVIRRQFDVQEGELYNSSLIAESKKNVEFTDYFSRVDLAETRISDTLVDLDMEVADKRTGMFTVGMGYSSVEYFTSMVQLQQNNLFGKGYKGSAKAEFSTKRTEYAINFLNPWLFDRPLSFGFDVNNKTSSYYEYDKKETSAGISFGHQPIKRKLFLRYALRFADEEIYAIDSDASDYIKDQEGRTQTIQFAPSIRWTTLNHPFNPTGGQEAYLGFRRAGGILGGDQHFYAVTSGGTQYVPLGGRFTGVANIDMGYVKATEGEIPVDERYRIGGMYTIRGFSYGKITSYDSDGLAYGGNKKFVSNIEIKHPLTSNEQLIGVVFHDAGNVWSEEDKFFSGELRRSVGFGFRWYSPIGPLRLEYGRKINKRENESLDRWEFTVGGLF